MSGFGADPSAPAPDQQQQGGIDPALLAQMQQGAPQGAVAPADGPAAGGDPSQAQGPPQSEYSDQQPLDLTGCISHAIEAGAQQASAATTVSAQDFAQLSSGILALCQALAALQPKADPAQAGLDAAAISALQRHKAAEMQQQTARDRADAQAHAQAQQQATRPTAVGT